MCVVLLGYAPAATASMPAVDVSVPVVPCAFSSADVASLRQQHLALPGRVPATLSVGVPLPPGSAVYGVKFPASGSEVDYTVAPSDYVCAPEYASADGGAAQYIEGPAGTGLGVSAVFDPGGIGPRHRSRLRIHPCRSRGGRGVQSGKRELQPPRR